MPVYTVHEPPPRRSESAADPDRFDFVRDGFHFWAFLLAPLWMLWRRLWLVFVLYLVVFAALQAGLWFLGASSSVKFAANLLLAILVGLEAPTLRRWKLARSKWLLVDVVVADDLEMAERRFFEAWERQGTPPASEPPAPPPLRPAESAPNEVLGLFPQPGMPR
jgi:hypothetical protein